MKKTIFIFKFVKKTPGTILTNISRIPRSLQLYNHYYQHRQEEVQKDYQKYLEAKSSQNFKTILTNSVQKVSEKVKNTPQILREKLNKAKDQNAYQENSQTIFTGFFKYLALYYESLQNLVEGRREVLHDEDFKFEDGKTAQQKSDILEEKIRLYYGKGTQKIKKKIKINPKK